MRSEKRFASPSSPLGLTALVPEFYKAMLFLLFKSSCVAKTSGIITLNSTIMPHIVPSFIVYEEFMHTLSQGFQLPDNESSEDFSEKIDSQDPVV